MSIMFSYIYARAYWVWPPIILMGCIFWGAWYYSPSTTACSIGTHVLRFEKPIFVTLRTTQSEQAEGLSGKESLADDEGMLFVFDTIGSHKFWMKDMKFAIDIISLDADLRVAGIMRNVTPESYPAVFPTPENMRYVLEVVSGYAEKEGVTVGDTAVLSPCPS